MGPGFESPKVHHKSVILSQRVHLYPFRTQKLSSAEATILGWRRPGKIVHCWYRCLGLEIFEPRRVGIIITEGPPVPIPNTEVKLCGGKDTWLATARENSSMPTPIYSWPNGWLYIPLFLIFLLSSSPLTRQAVLLPTSRKEEYSFHFIFLLSSVGRAHDC